MKLNEIFWIKDVIYISWSVDLIKTLLENNPTNIFKAVLLFQPLCCVSLQACAGINPTVVLSLILSVDSLCPASGQRDSYVLLCGGLCSLEQLKAWQLHPMTVQTQSTLGTHIKQSPLQKPTGKLTMGCWAYLFIFHI